MVLPADVPPVAAGLGAGAALEAFHQVRVVVHQPDIVTPISGPIPKPGTGPTFETPGEVQGVGATATGGAGEPVTLTPKVAGLGKETEGLGLLLPRVWFRAVITHGERDFVPGRREAEASDPDRLGWIAARENLPRPGKAEAQEIPHGEAGTADGEQNGGVCRKR